MENVKNEIVIEDELLKEDDFSEEELNDETIDWKAKAQELKGLNKRRASKLAKAKEALAKKPENPLPKAEPKIIKTEFDYAELAYLEAKTVAEEDHEFLFQEVQTTGKSLKYLLGLNYIKEELKNKKDARIVKDVTPKGTKRSGASHRDDVDYWINKGGSVMDIPDVELRRKVVNERIRRDKDSSKFAGS